MKIIEQETKKTHPTISRVPWQPLTGLVFVILLYYVSQIAAGLLVSIYPALRHYSEAQANNWLNNSVAAQFVYVLLAETFTVGAVYLFVKHYKLRLAAIGLKRPRWRDPVWGLAMLPVYYLIYVVAVGVISHFVLSLNVNQQQQIGFTSVHGALPFIIAFISLVVLPPIAEEIMVRGFLYSSLKKGLPTAGAALLTSLLFASAHLPEGGAAGPLYIAAIDTFILSLVLIYIREKTGSLWGCITLHALKNGIAFVMLFVLNVH